MNLKVTQPNVEELTAIGAVQPTIPQANRTSEPSPATFSRLQTKLITFVGGLVAILLAGVICTENVALAQQEEASVPPLVKMPFTQEEQLAFFLTKSSLSEEQLIELKTKVDNDPTEIAGRMQLLAYYRGRSSQNIEARTSLHELVGWFIKNYPEDIGFPAIFIDPGSDPEGYLEIKKHWLEVIEQYPDNAKIVCNAAVFALLADPDWGDELLNKATELEIIDSNTAKRIGMVYGLRLMAEQSKNKRQWWAGKALEHYELAIDLTKEPSELSPLRIMAATVALDVGKLQSAKTHAQQLLLDEDSDDSIHSANIILGRLALQSGDREKAKAHLLAAGRVSSTPELTRSGPDMLLARELLRVKETEAVLEYFKLCENLWKKPELKQWAEQVKDGRIPHFGSSLLRQPNIDW